MRKIKIKLVEATKNLARLGLNNGSEGNISCRFGDSVFITPSGMDALKLDELKIVEVDLDGKIKNGQKPSSEILMHLKIYKNKRKIKAIVHCHSMWASILSCQRLKIPAFHYMVAEFGGEDIKCSKYATFGSNKLANNVLNVVKDRNGCLISNHGQLTIAENLDNAVNLALALEKLSKQYYFCNLTKKTKVLSQNEMLKNIKLFRNYKAKH